MRYFLILLVAAVVCSSAAATGSDSAISGGVKTFDARLSDYEYPFEVAFFQLESQGKSLKMAYMYLQGEKGKPVITLFHGKNFNGAYWEQTARLLHKMGYGVLIPDQIGFGKSSKPVDYQYSFSALAYNTKALVTSLNIDHSVCIGHSMGGMLASRFALNYPQTTIKLVLVNPIGLENYLHFVDYKDIDFFYQNELKKTPEKIIAYQKKNYYDGAWNQQYEALTIPLTGWIQGPDWKQIAYVNALTYDMIFTQPVVEEFKNLQAPAALILGVRDRTGPGRNWKKDGVQYELGRYDQLGQRIKSRNVNIQVHEIDGLGHLPHIEDFNRFKDVLMKVLQ